MAIKVYCFTHRYKQNVECRTESLDLEELKERKARCDD